MSISDSVAKSEKDFGKATSHGQKEDSVGDPMEISDELIVSAPEQKKPLHRLKRKKIEKAEEAVTLYDEEEDESAVEVVSKPKPKEIGGFFQQTQKKPTQERAVAKRGNGKKINSADPSVDEESEAKTATYSAKDREKASFDLSPSLNFGCDLFGFRSMRFALFLTTASSARIS
jgi:hypothetical protein